jgi:tetratricopeptide (TPR) repeat protein
MLGAALSTKGELNSAIEHFQQVLATDPENTFALANLGHAYYLNKDYSSAIAMLRHALSLKPDYLSAENELAWIYASAEDPNFRDPAQALRLARHAVQTSPEPAPTILDTLAEALLLDGQPVEALHTEEQASKLAPANPRFRARLTHFREAVQCAAAIKP